MKMKNKITKVQPDSLAESPNKAIVKKKNRNNKKKNKALKNMNGNIGTLVSDATVVVTSTISEGKKKKKKRKKKNKNLEHLNETTCGPQTDVTMKDVLTVPKKNKDISDANHSVDILGNKNIEGNVSVSEAVAISKKGVKDLKGSAEVPMADKESINDNAEISIKDIDKKTENSMIAIPVDCKSTISKKKKKKKNKKQQQQQPMIEREALIKDTEEINDDAETPMEDIKNIDEKAETSQFDVSVTSTSTISKKKRKKKKKQQQQQQQQLPGVSTNKPDGDPGEPDTDVKKKKKKRKISEVESTPRDTSSDVKASKIVRKESGTETIMQKGSTRNLEEEERTIFLGNVNIKTKRRDLSRLFSKYGKVETVRIRSAAVADPRKNKKVTVITGNYNNLRTSVNAYVRFKTKDMVTAALEANGVELNGKHLRVDRAFRTEDQSIQHSVFVGNLPIEAEEEAFRSHFADCGKIHSVRIIRDKDFTSCKGFGYVNFMSPDSIEFALQLNNSIFMHRQLRVQRCIKKAKKNKFKNKRGKKGVGFVNLQKARTESTKPKGDGDFSGMKMVETNKFKKMKKAKGKLSEGDKKKLAVSLMLTGVKAKIKKTT